MTMRANKNLYSRQIKDSPPLDPTERPGLPGQVLEAVGPAHLVHGHQGERHQGQQLYRVPGSPVTVQERLSGRYQS